MGIVIGAIEIGTIACEVKNLIAARYQGVVCILRTRGRTPGAGRDTAFEFFFDKRHTIFKTPTRDPLTAFVVRRS